MKINKKQIKNWIVGNIVGTPEARLVADKVDDSWNDGDGTLRVGALVDDLYTIFEEIDSYTGNKIAPYAFISDIIEWISESEATRATVSILGGKKTNLFDFKRNDPYIHQGIRRLCKAFGYRIYNDQIITTVEIKEL